MEVSLLVFFYLVLGHFITDYIFQSDFVAKHKSRKNNLADVPWYYIMFSHAAAHAATVITITGNPWLGLAELLVHYAIDVGKCESYFNIHIDQALHILCKLIWVLFL